MTRFRDSLYLGLLALYILAGCLIVPLHGDEPSVIYTSLDVDLIRHFDLAHLVYSDPPPADDKEAAAKQELRFRNGVANRYTYGLMWLAAGMTPADINNQWVWGADLNYNQSTGHVPTDDLLFLCRWASGLLTVLLVAVVFVIAKRAGGTLPAYAASFIFTMTPSVLMNGRRAVMESGFLLCSALCLYAAQRLFERRTSLPRLTRRAVLLFGVTCGLAFASKQTGLMTVLAAFGAIGLYILIARGFMVAVRSVLPLAGALLLTAVVFLALNPVWWSSPLQMPGIILKDRSVLLQGQMERFGPFTGVGDRAAMLVRELTIAPPQYYEAKLGWSEWIKDEITIYEASPLRGIQGPLWSVLIAGLLIVGLVRSALNWRNAASTIITLFGLLTAAAVFVATPMGWQRYYLPIILPAALICGLAFTHSRDTSQAR